MQLSQLLVVKNMQESVKFYEEVLGFTLSQQVAKNEAGELTYAMLTKDEGKGFGNPAFHIMPEGAHMRTQFPMRTTEAKDGFNNFISAYVDTDADVNAIKAKVEEAQKNGAKVTLHGEAKKCEWCNGYFIYFTDINGQLWYIASYEKAFN